jgi:hypothetical protein
MNCQKGLRVNEIVKKDLLAVAAGAARRHVAHAATARGGRPCRRCMWRPVSPAVVDVRRIEPCRHSPWRQDGVVVPVAASLLHELFEREGRNIACKNPVWQAVHCQLSLQSCLRSAGQTKSASHAWLSCCGRRSISKSELLIHYERKH